MILAISMSKPSGASEPGFLEPRPGWSNLTPILMVPASLSLAIVVPAANDGVLLDLHLGVVTSAGGECQGQRGGNGQAAAYVGSTWLIVLSSCGCPGYRADGPLWIVTVSG